MLMKSLLSVDTGGTIKVNNCPNSTIDGETYYGSIINMGIKNPDGSVCYIKGILKDIRAKIGKQPGDTLQVTVQERE